MTKMLSNTRDYSREWFMVTRIIDGKAVKGQMLGRSIGMVFASFANRVDVLVSFNDQGVHVIFQEDNRHVTYHVGGRHHVAWAEGVDHAPLLKVWARILKNQDVSGKVERILV